MEGSRPILVEIEALTTYTKFGYPKRSARWIQWGKLDLLIAVISRFTKVNLESYDTYLNVARGLTIQEPGTDLASIAAIISSKLAKPLGNIVLLWEVSLTGLIKPVAQIRRRIDEAVKLGFTTIVVPKWADTTKIKMKNIKIIEVGKISDLPGIL
jgi:DNA repair protein RadA/Sms